MKALSLSRLPPGSIAEVSINGETYTICNAGGEVHALGGVCPHRGGPLGQGALHGTTLVCPWHAWEFDCVTGEYDFNAEIKLRKYTAKVEGDDILVEVA